MTKRPASFFVAVAALTLIVSAAVLANNPIAVNLGGRATRWNAANFPISYTTDLGTLGALSNVQANTLTSDAFGAWSGVATSSVTAVAGASGISDGGTGDGDGDIETAVEFAGMGCVGVNPIVYDNDGSITDGLLGAGAKNNVLGFAGPCAIQPAANPALNPDIITGGRATMNGFLITSNVGLAFSKSKGVFIHELGHLLGVGHSQVNLNCLTNQPSCPSNTPGGDLFGVPTMFPILLNQTEVANTSYSETLTVDDQSAISTLYPNANNSFSNNFGTLNGNVFFSEGTNEAQGINVIARRVGDPRVTAISNVSGMFAQANRGNGALGLAGSSSGDPDPTKRGDYTIPGLPAGTYTVEIESINPSFIGGSRVGALSGSTGRNENIPIPSPAVAECLSTVESNTDGVDACLSIVVAAGNILNGNNFILNETFAALDASDLAARNENIGIATPIGAGTFTRWLSGPNGADDVDVYAVNVTSGVPISIDVKSRRLTPIRYIDGVIDIRDAGSNILTTCRILSGAYNQPCVGDDHTPTGGSFTLDPHLEFTPATTGVVFVTISDAFGDARPDFIYEMTIGGVAPQNTVIFTPAALDFGPQPVGITSFTQNIQVTNTGVAGINLTGFTKVGGQTGDFNFVAPTAGAPACNTGAADVTALAAGGSCFFGLQFTPGAAGARSTTARVTHTAVDSPSNMTVSGTGSAGPPNDNFAAASSTSPHPYLDFQDTRLATQEAGDISIAPGGIPLPGPSCTVNPLPANNRSIWYKYLIPTNANSQADVTLLTNYNSALAFAVLFGGNLFPQACFDVGANVQTQLTITGIQDLSGSTLYFMVAAAAGDGGITNVEFTFTPVATVVDLSIAVTDNNLVFTEGTNGTYTVMVSNAGGGGATATTPDLPVQVTDILPQGFTYVSGGGNGWICNAANGMVTCSFGSNTIAAGGNSQFNITVLPSAPAAANSPVTNSVQVFGGGDTSSVFDAGFNNTGSDTTNVNPAPAPVVDIAPPSKDFGSVGVGTTSANQSFTLLNSGNGTLTVNGITKTGTDAGQFNLLLAPAFADFTCPSVFPFNLTAGASCTMGANFAPTGAGGARSANISVASNASTSPNLVPLSGTSVPQGTLAASATNVNFGSVVVGQASTVQTVVLSNTGAGDLTVETLDGTGDDDFNLVSPTIAGDCPQTGVPPNNNPAVPFPLTSGASCNLRATFNPTALGLRQFDVTATASNSTVPSVNFTLTGTGTGGDITFTNGGGDGLWTNTANWDLGRIPIAGDTVHIPSAFNVTLSGGAAHTIGVLDLTSTGTLTITGAGTSLTFTNASTATNLTINGGTLTANAALNITGALTFLSGLLNGTGNITLNSPLTWTGGTIGGTGTFTNNGTGPGAASISGGTLDGKTFVNAGTATFSGNFLMTNNAVLTNQAAGTVNAQGVGGITKTGAVPNMNFNNQGTFNRNGAAGQFQFGGVNFNNSGTVNITSGELAVSSTDYIQSGGTTTLNAGGGDLRAISSSIAIGGGVLKGTGSILSNFALGNVLQNTGGSVQPGLSAGILSVGANGAGYLQGAGGSLDIEIGGTTAGTQYDQLSLAGSATLGGTLNVSLINPFVPQAGDSFTILTSVGARSGTFATTNLPSLPGRQWNIAYNANSVVLSVAAVAGTITFTNGGGDNLWTNPLNWDLGRIPIAGDTVVINGVAPNSANVTLNGGGAHTIAVLNMTSAGTLTINGGAQLITTGASNATTIAVNGDGAGVGGADGRLTANNTLTVGTLSVANGGLVDGSGNVTVNTLLTWGSAVANGTGTIGGTGTLTNNGTSSIPQGALDGKTYSANGTSNIGGSLAMSNGATFNNLATRTINAQPGAGGGGITQGAGATSTLNNQGTFVLNPGIAVNFDVTGIAFNHSGTTTITTGSLGILGTGVYTQTGAGAITEVGNANGDMTVANPLQLQGGILRGRRTINGAVNNTGGTIAPGLSAGILTVNGSYTQGANPAATTIEIGGTTPGTAANQHDQLNVTGAPGTVTLSGTLNVSLLGGFVPAIGDSFTIVTSTGVLAGTFGANLNFPALPAGRAWRIRYNVSGNNVVLDIVAPAVTFAPTSFDFGNVQVGVPSATTDVQLTNSGLATLNIASISLTGTDAAQFAIVAPTAGTNCVGLATRNPGQSCNIGVRFSPASIGLKAAQISVVDDAVGSPHTVPLSGTGQVPFGVFGPPSPFNFGNQPIGTNSAPRVINLSNIGPGTTLAVTAVAFGGTDPGDFIFANTGCTPLPFNVVFPVGICSVTVTFRPNSTGAKSATVTFTDNSNNVPGTQQVFTVNGNGIAATVNLSPNPTSFGNQRKGTPSVAQTVTVTNSGTDVANLGAITIIGANAGDFALAGGDTCVANATALAASPGPGNTCTINVTFSPTATGARTGTLNVVSNATGSPHQAVLNGTGIAPIANVAPDPFNFGTRINGTVSAAQTFTVLNTGTDTLNIASIVLGGADAAEFNFVNAGAGSCAAAGGVVAAGGNCTFTVIFAPATSGAKVATVTVTDDDNAVPGSTQVVDLSGTGQTPPTANFSTLNIPFGSQRVGTSSAATTVTVTNNGEFPLEMVSLSLTGTDPSQFVLTNSGAGPCSPLPRTVAGGSNCTFTVAFGPTSTGAKAANVSASHNGNATGTPGTVTDVALTGTGIQANITLAPNPGAFGNQRVTTPSAPMAITVTNSGTDIATLAAANAVTITGANAADFVNVGTGTCANGTVLAAAPGPGNTCTINIVFTPSATGARAATVNVADDAPGSPQTAALTGTGIQANITLAPNPANFGNVKVGTPSAPLTVTVTNSGTDVATLAAANAVTITGANAAEFVNDGTGTCVNGLVLAASPGPGNTCTVNTVFTPTALGDRGPVTLNITDDAPGSPQQATLNGTGVLANLTFNPSPLNFGSLNLGSNITMGITIANTGTLAATLGPAALTITGAEAADFAIAAGTTCAAGTVLAAGGGSCITNIMFTPGALGARAAQLNVPNDAPGNPHAVPLSGTGTQPGFNLSTTTPPNFGSVQVGMSQAGAAITLSNPGTGTLTITSITVVAGGANPAAGDFSRSTTCPLAPATLAAGGNCTITPSMAPQAGSVGPRTANISIVHNAAGSPGTIALAGTAVDFAVITTATPGPVTAGGSALYSLNFDTLGGDSLFPTTFACTAGLPRKAECIFTPPSLPAGSPDTTVQLTITTTSNTVTVSSAGVAGPVIPTDGDLPPGGWLAIGIGVLGLFAAATLRRQALRLSAARLCLLGLLLMAGGYVAGCAGEGVGFPEGASGTPPGSYTVTVTATSGTVQRTTNITLNVQ